jgi:hypothetical protein
MSLKAFAKSKPKTFAALVFLIVSFAILHMFSVWQLDIICVDPVWKYGWKQPEPRYADQPFQCWLWRTTIGEAYDTLLFLNFVGFYGTVVCFVYLLYEILKMRTLRLSDLKV